MSRRRRQLFSGKVYELVFRVKEGLPFVCADYMNTLLLGILARVQRDAKLTLCHYVVMANHLHLIVVTKDKQKATDFIQEFKKKTTDALKRLHGKQYLSNWELNSGVIILPTQADVEERIRYLYCNPAKAHLVESIEEYPGLSSWRAFLSSPLTIKGAYSTCHPWISTPNIPLITKGISPKKDYEISRRLKASSNVSHELIIEPHAWLRCFGSKGISKVAQRISRAVMDTEQTLKKIRREEKRGIFGISRLRNEIPLLQGYFPKKKERKIFIICHDRELRMHFINLFKALCRKCEECYQLMCRGEEPPWPPSAFIPPTRSFANALRW